MKWDKISADLATNLADESSTEMTVVVSPARPPSEQESETVGALAAHADRGRPYNITASPADVDLLSEQDWVRGLSAPKQFRPTS